MPQGWEWARLQDVCSYIQRGKSPVYSEIKQYPVIAQKCNQWSGFSIEKAQFIAPDTISKYNEERILRDKDLLWNSTGLGTLGRMAVYRTELNPYGWAVADSHVTVIRPISGMAESLFFYLFFASPIVQSVIEDKAEGSTKQKELYVDTVKEYLIPVPPYREQKRIVAKIEEVLPEVLKYGNSQKKLDELNEELNERLRKSILHEAIQGRLVPQNPSEVSAISLLEQVESEKQKLLKEGKLKKKDIIDSVIFKGDDNKYYEKVGGKVLDISDEIPFDIPESWSWIRLQQVCTYIHRGKSPKYSEVKKFPVIAQKCNQWDGFHIEKAQFIAPESVPSYADDNLLRDKDLLWNSTGLGTLGRIGLYPASSNPYGFAVADSHVTVIRTLPEFIRPEFLLMYFCSPTVQSVIEDKASGSTKQKELATETVKSYIVPIPPLSEQDRILDKYKTVLANWS